MKEEMKQWVKQELKKKWQWSNGAISDEDNEGSESSVHDGDTVASDDDSGSLETRKKRNKKTNLNNFFEQKVVLDQQSFFDQICFGSNSFDNNI